MFSMLSLNTIFSTSQHLHYSVSLRPISETEFLSCYITTTGYFAWCFLLSACCFYPVLQRAQCPKVSILLPSKMTGSISLNPPSCHPAAPRRNTRPPYSVRNSTSYTKSSAMASTVTKVELFLSKTHRHWKKCLHTKTGVTHFICYLFLISFCLKMLIAQE